MGKDTKFCRNCGKELPIESTFCPYCMTKLIDVTTGGEIKVKKKKPIIIAVSAAIVLLVVIAVIIILNSTILAANRIMLPHMQQLFRQLRSRQRLKVKPRIIQNMSEYGAIKTAIFQPQLKTAAIFLR